MHRRDSHTRLQSSYVSNNLVIPFFKVLSVFLEIPRPQLRSSIGMATSKTVQDGLLGWIPIDSRLCAVRMRDSCKVNGNLSDRHIVPIISTYVPTDCSPDAIKDSDYQKLRDFLLTTRPGDIVILEWNLNAWTGRIYSNAGHFGDPFGFDSRRSENRERL